MIGHSAVYGDMRYIGLPHRLCGRTTSLYRCTWLLIKYIRTHIQIVANVKGPKTYSKAVKALFGASS